MLNLFFYNYAIIFVLLVDFRATDNKIKKLLSFPGATPFLPKGEANRR